MISINITFVLFSGNFKVLILVKFWPPYSKGGGFQPLGYSKENICSPYEVMVTLSNKMEF